MAVAPQGVSAPAVSFGRPTRSLTQRSYSYATRCLCRRRAPPQALCGTAGLVGLARCVKVTRRAHRLRGHKEVVRKAYASHFPRALLLFTLC